MTLIERREIIKISVEDKFGKSHRDIKKWVVYFCGIPVYRHTKAFAVTFTRFEDTRSTHYLNKEVGFKTK